MMITGGSAFAADLGGNCCADLEERVAELEATTARKGNRKVSLTITGWVSSQLYWFDDGHESNVYVVDNATDLASNFKFTGSAQIAPGWKAGYSLWIYADPTDSLLTNHTTDDAGFQLSIENSYWWIESDHWGKLSVGRQSGVADNAALGTDFTGTLFPANSVTFDGGFLFLRESDGAPGLAGYTGGTWQQLLWCETVGVGIGNDCSGLRTDNVTYNTPTFSGFSAGVSWGEDDQWDVALRYAGEFGGFKMSFATAYTEITDNAGALQFIDDTQHWQIGGTIKHLASGLWFHGEYHSEEIDNATKPDADGFYLKAGWSPKFNHLGTTHFYGEYGENQDQVAGLNNIVLSAGNPPTSVLCNTIGASGGGSVNAACADPLTIATGGEVQRWGVGVVQEIDAAAMSLWAKWRHHEGDLQFVDSAGVAGSTSFEDVDMFLAGAVIFY
jgi:predicted porin